VISLIALAIGVYAVYTVRRGVSESAWELVAAGLLALVAAAGLALRQRWSEPLVYVVFAVAAATWITSVVTGGATLVPRLVELAPGILLLASCVAGSVVVFRHFHPRQSADPP
jgi:hypothetical protein